MNKSSCPITMFLPFGQRIIPRTFHGIRGLGLALFCTCLSTAAHAIERVKFFSLDEGLSSREVNAIIQDSRGMLWVGTSTGLNYFDGLQFRRLSPTGFDDSSFPAYNILDLAEDEAGNLWICTSSGAVALNPQRDRLLSLSALGIPDSVAQHRNLQVESHPEGGFWVLAGQFLYRYHKHNGQYRLSRQNAQAADFEGQVKMYASKRGQLWFYSKNQGLYSWRRNALHLIQNCNPVASPQGKINLGKAPYPVSVTNSLGDSLTLFYTMSRRVVFVDEAQNCINPGVAGFLDNSFQPWMSVLKYVKDNPEITGNNNLGLEHIFIDQTQTYWLCTNMGLFVVRGPRPRRFEQIDFLRGQSIRGMYEDDDGAWWFGAYNGLYKYLPGREPLYYPEWKAVWDFAPAGKNTLWLATETPDGLVLLDLRKGQSILKYILPEYFSYVVAKKGNTLFSGGNLSEIHALDALSGSLKYRSSLQPGSIDMHRPAVKTIIFGRDSSLWAAGEVGLFHLKKDTGGQYRQDTAGIPALLRTMRINGLYEDQRNNLWIASRNQGLIRFTPATGQMAMYGISDGLAHPITYSILGSHADSLLWIGTQKGLSCLNVFEGYFHNYYESDGLAQNEFNTAAARRARNGDLYFGGLNGVTRFTPFIPEKYGDSTRVHIALQFGGNASQGKGWIFPLAGQSISVRQSENFFEIQLHSNEYFDAGQVTFRYRIAEAEQPWQTAGAANKIVFARLSPGRHTLVAQARSPYGHWGQEFVLKLTILPPWYRTWWFAFLLSLLFIAAAYALFQLHVARIKREYELRKQVSDDLHDDLGSRLYALHNLARRIVEQRKNGMNTPRLAEQFDALSKDTLRTLRNFIWAFDPKNDSIDDLIDRMEDFADTVIRPIVPAMAFSHDPVPDHLAIKPLFKHHIMLSFQEILTNMVKHTSPEKIGVHIYMEGSTLAVLISNTCTLLQGSAETGGGGGTESIAARLRAINGKMEWSENGNEQVAKLTMPVRGNRN